MFDLTLWSRRIIGALLFFSIFIATIQLIAIVLAMLGLNFQEYITYILIIVPFMIQFFSVNAIGLDNWKKFFEGKEFKVEWVGSEWEEED